MRPDPALSITRALLEHPLGLEDAAIEVQHLRLALGRLFEYVRCLQGVTADRSTWWRRTKSSRGLVGFAKYAEGVVDISIEELWWISSDYPSRARTRLTREDLVEMLEMLDE